MVDFVKGRWTKFNDKRKEYGEEQLDELTDIIVSDWRLYEKMGQTFGFVGGWRSSRKKLDYETRLER
jgi:hypothetical protein